MSKTTFKRGRRAFPGGEGMRGPRRLLFLLAAGALSMALGAGVWALPAQNQLRATVPTRTPTKPSPTEAPPTEAPATQVPATEAPTQAPATPEPTKRKSDKKEPTQAPTATEVAPTAAAVAQVAVTATTNPVTTVQQFPKTGMDLGPLVLGAVCALSLGAGAWLAMAWRAIRRRSSGSR
jgi:outer membrane biosynthesis protein TonB